MDWMPQRHSAAYATAPDTEPDHIHPRYASADSLTITIPVSRAN